MKIPLLRGRNLMRGDTHAVIVSQSLARRLWPGEDPLTKQLPVGTDSAGAPVKYSVVGVAGNARSKLEDPDMVEALSAHLSGRSACDGCPGEDVGPPEALDSVCGNIARTIDSIFSRRSNAEEFISPEASGHGI